MINIICEALLVELTDKFPKHKWESRKEEGQAHNDGIHSVYGRTKSTSLFIYFRADHIEAYCYQRSSATLPIRSNNLLYTTLPTRSNNLLYAHEGFIDNLFKWIEKVT